MTKTNTTITPDTIASELNIDAKAVRRHLRAIVDLHNAKHADNPDKQINKPGRGGSWSVSPDMIDLIKARLNASGAGRNVTISAKDLT